MTPDTIRDTVAGVSATGIFPGDIVSVSGSNAYIGFTTGTGGTTARQNILKWTFTGGMGCSQN
jgi:hypothetical protein